MSDIEVVTYNDKTSLCTLDVPLDADQIYLDEGAVKVLVNDLCRWLTDKTGRPHTYMTLSKFTDIPEGYYRGGETLEEVIAKGFSRSENDHIPYVNRSIPEQASCKVSDTLEDMLESARQTRSDMAYSVITQRQLDYMENKG